MTSSPPKLRVGLLLGGMEVSAWVMRMIERIQASGSAEIVLLVVDDSPHVAYGTPLLTRLRSEPVAALKQLWRGVMERVYGKVCQWPAMLPDAFSPKSLKGVLDHLPTIRVVPKRTQWSDRLSDAEIQAIRGHDVDVLVRIGFRILRGDILTVARHGVWSFHHGDNQVNRGGPPGFWEAMEGWPETGCTLQILSEDLDNGLVLDRTWSATIPQSVVDNNRSTYWKSLAMLPRQLDALHRKGAERFYADAKAAEPDPQLYSRRLYRPAEDREYWQLLLRGLKRRVRASIQARLTFDQWILLVHFSDSFSASFWRYKRILPPKDRFWADPFAIERDGQHHIFLEELPFATGKGHISVMTVQPDGTHSEPRIVIDEPHHLSYPFLLEHGGELYMIPEAKMSGSIPLYRCVEFPHRWEKLAPLMTGVAAVDATVHHHDGRWWLFVNMVEEHGASSCDELFIFHADTFPTTEWQPHPMNPVVSDVRRARPAGRLFVQGGRLYRPSQNCGPRYGWGWNLNLIETLTPDDYRERVVSQAEPTWAPDLIATHTFNTAGRLHVIDVQIRRRR